MRRWLLIAAWVSAVPGSAAVVETARPVLTLPSLPAVSAVSLSAAPALAVPSLSAAPLSAPSLSAAPLAAAPAAAPALSAALPAAYRAAAPAKAKPASAVAAAAAPALRALTARLAAADAGKLPDAALAGSFDGAAVNEPAAVLEGFRTDDRSAPELSTLEADTRALLRRYLPKLYRPLPVKFITEESKLGGGGGHYFDPAEGHVISMNPGRVGEDGRVASAFGQTQGLRVSPRVEETATSVHEFAHALFDDYVGRDGALRPGETAYDAMTEGFAVAVERLVLEGMVRDAAALGLTERDVQDARGILHSRAIWLRTEDTHYAEGWAVWSRLRDEGGEDALLAFLKSLDGRRLTSVPRVDPVYQASLGSPETARAYLGGGDAALRDGLLAARRAAKGEALSTEETAAAARAVDAAGPGGWEWLARRALAREIDLGEPGDPLWVVPAFLRRADDLAGPLFKLAKLSAGLAAAAARTLLDAATRPDGLTHLFETPGPSTRLMTIAAGAEALPWAPEAKRAWDAALARWLAANPAPGQ